MILVVVFCVHVVMLRLCSDAVSIHTHNVVVTHPPNNTQGAWAMQHLALHHVDNWCVLLIRTFTPIQS